MTALPATGALGDIATSQGTFRGAIEQVVAWLKETILNAPQSVTVSAGVIAPTTGSVIVTPEGAAADDLTNIGQSTLADGQLLLVRPVAASPIVTMKHGAGGTGQLNLSNNADFLLNHVDAWVLLKRNGSLWDEVMCFDGNRLITSSFGRSVMAANDASAVRTLLSLGTAALATIGTSGATVPLLNTVNTWSKGQITAPVTLTDAATVAWNLQDGNKFKLTIGGNRTLGTPSNKVDGQSFEIVITQDGTGGRTLAYHGDFKFPGGTAPVLSTGIGKVDRLVGSVHGSVVHAMLIKDFS